LIRCHTLANTSRCDSPLKQVFHSSPSIPTLPAESHFHFPSIVGSGSRCEVCVISLLLMWVADFVAEHEKFWKQPSQKCLYHNEFRCSVGFESYRHNRAFSPTITTSLVEADWVSNSLACTQMSLLQLNLLREAPFPGPYTWEVVSHPRRESRKRMFMHISGPSFCLTAFTRSIHVFSSCHSLAQVGKTGNMSLGWCGKSVGYLHLSPLPIYPFNGRCMFRAKVNVE